jgi:hypothetical protein
MLNLLQLAVDAATDESHYTLCKRPKLTFAKHASIASMQKKLVPPSSRFFLQQWP